MHYLASLDQKQIDSGCLPLKGRIPTLISIALPLNIHKRMPVNSTLKTVGKSCFMSVP